MDTNEANLVRMIEKQVPKRALVPFDVDFQWVGTFVEWNESWFRILKSSHSYFYSVLMRGKHLKEIKRI